jgi:hypothetical protein
VSTATEETGRVESGGVETSGEETSEDLEFWDESEMIRSGLLFIGSKILAVIFN